SLTTGQIMTDEFNVSGTLLVDVSGVEISPSSIELNDLVRFNKRNGEFSEVNVLSNSECAEFDGEPVFYERSMSVLVTVRNDRCAEGDGGGDDDEWIVYAVVGAVVG